MGPITFAGNYIDRVGELRTQHELLEAALTHAATLFMPVWQGHCLVRGERLAMLPRAVAEPLLPKVDELIFLGKIEGMVAADETLAQEIEFLRRIIED